MREATQRQRQSRRTFALLLLLPAEVALHVPPRPLQQPLDGRGEVKDGVGIVAVAVVRRVL